MTTYTPTDFVWKSEAVAEKEYVPHEKISLEVKGEVYALGQYSNCYIKKPLEQLASGQVSRIQCWFGGAGNELAVYKENGNYVVKKRWIQEGAGPGVNVDRNGPWEVVVTLP
jgi:hypothetical protein